MTRFQSRQAAHLSIWTLSRKMTLFCFPEKELCKKFWKGGNQKKYK